MYTVYYLTKSGHEVKHCQIEEYSDGREIVETLFKYPDTAAAWVELTENRSTIMTHSDRAAANVRARLQ